MLPGFHFLCSLFPVKQTTTEIDFWGLATNTLNMIKQFKDFSLKEGLGAF